MELNKPIPLHTETRSGGISPQGRLLFLAGLFLFLYAAGLSLAPAVRVHSWQADLRWGHWAGFGLWLLVFSLAHWQTSRWLPDRDPFLLPVIALVAGWGILTIWRLLPGFGLRQSLWLVVAGGVLIAGLRVPSDLDFLRRYKYVWLISALVLTALTFVIGVNPQGDGSRMWLGCCGVYLQPSEPLKLLLIGYLAAYLADSQALIALTQANRQTQRRFSIIDPLVYLLAPTLLMTFMALALLGLQRDLGTASIILFIYAAIVYTASERKWIVLVALAAIILAGTAGYWLYGVVRIRVDAWLNPWLDPSGGSYQIIQALLAVANGGILGRGPGLGSPGLTPVVHSDLIYTAVAEEQGLLGALGMLLALALLAIRGLRAALHAADSYRRYLAVGLTAYLVGQGLMIIGGSLRLLPLTGITLPFVAYGGSSLVTAFLALLLLLHISRGAPTNRYETVTSRGVHHLNLFLLAGLAAAAIASGWWALVRAPALLGRTDNPRRAVEERWSPRGALLARNLEAINQTQGLPGEMVRAYNYPDLSSVVGYDSPAYGQSGLESGLDGYLRGLQALPAQDAAAQQRIGWYRLVYGQPPPGMDARLSLDLQVQHVADSLLHGRQGAVVALNARTGEILAMASQPTFDAGKLDSLWNDLLNNPQSPLVNRAIQGRYPLGMLQAELFPPAESGDGLPSGLRIVPSPRLPLSSGDLSAPDDPPDIASPLQVALAAAAVTSGGQRPEPALVLALRQPEGPWQDLPAAPSNGQPLSPQAAQAIAAHHTLPGKALWQHTVAVRDSLDQAVTWQIVGTLPGGEGPAYVVVVLLEEINPRLADEIGLGVMDNLLGR
jgi:cell division protein FtsW (lipid II flippase)